jgi:hypothetical protein
MESAGFKERRSFARFPVKVILKYLNLNLPQEAHTQTLNISAEGICLVAKEVIEAETPLDIWLQMPDNGEQIYVKGKVAWASLVDHDRYNIGVNLDDAELNPILLALKTIQVRIRHH